jgi:hypothetical protein
MINNVSGALVELGYAIDCCPSEHREGVTAKFASLQKAVIMSFEDPPRDFKLTSWAHVPNVR